MHYNSGSCVQCARRCRLLLTLGSVSPRVVVHEVARTVTHTGRALGTPQVTTPCTCQPLLRPKALVATPNGHKAARIMLRHQKCVVAPLRPTQVKTLNVCRDIECPVPPATPKLHVAKPQACLGRDTRLPNSLALLS